MKIGIDFDTDELKLIKEALSHTLYSPSRVSTLKELETLRNLKDRLDKIVGK